MACLNRHSRVHIIGETRFFLTPYSHRRLWPRFADWVDAAVRQCFSGIDPSLAPYRERQPAEYRRIFDLERSGTAAEMFRRLLAGLAGEAGKAVYGEKTPLHFLALRSIFRSFPEARVIFVLRAFHKIEQSIQGRRNLAMSGTRLMALLHLQRVAMERFGDRIHKVQYTDLCNDSERTLRGICTYLDLEFEETMLRPGMQNSSRNADTFAEQGVYLVQDPEIGIAPVADEVALDIADIAPAPAPARLTMVRTVLRQIVADWGLNLAGYRRAADLTASQKGLERP